MEINVGEYVRTRDGIIKRVISYNPQENNPLWETLNGNVQMKGTITKHSKDIIKLLEKGDILVDYNDDLYVVDYIDGYYVFTTAKINKTTIKTLVDYQIKKVLTHEQFEANAYTIEKER